jgi:DNA-directed RNA polymerase specialized sigma24 family protein
MASDSLACTAMDDALRILAPEHRVALIRVHYLNESLADFALREGLSDAAAKLRLHHALHALRAAIAECDAIR